jgi:hypothetical protein
MTAPGISLSALKRASSVSGPSGGAPRTGRPSASAQCASIGISQMRQSAGRQEFAPELWIELDGSIKAVAPRPNINGAFRIARKKAVHTSCTQTALIMDNFPAIKAHVQAMIQAARAELRYLRPTDQISTQSKTPLPKPRAHLRKQAARTVDAL